jgi:hypothetical protein
MATFEQLLASRIYFKAVFPAIKVLLEDVPTLKKRFANVKAVVQFVAKDNKKDVGAYLCFQNGEFEVKDGISSSPTLTFSFSHVAKLNNMLMGRPVIPKIKGFWNFGLLFKVITLLLSLKILMPNVRPKTDEKIELKVKMVVYMITTALSQYNKAGDGDMKKWTGKQPERIYQISVEPEGIAAYLRIKAGHSMAGRGYYKKRHPFVHMKFHMGAKKALPVLMNDMELIEAVAKGYVATEGSEFYAADFSMFMLRIQDLITTPQHVTTDPSPTLEWSILCQ